MAARANPDASRAAVADSRIRNLAFDPVLRRPGCPLIQATVGGDRELVSQFPPKTWLLAPTPGMGLYPVTDDMVSALIALAERAIQPGNKGE